MSISINSTRYSNFISEVNTLLPTGTRVIITVYKDQAGSVVANDVNGIPVLEKQFSSLSYQYPTDSEPGVFSITFSDGCVFTINDGDEDNWYFINETPAGIVQFV
jgi:hypothetical protein